MSLGPGWAHFMRRADRQGFGKPIAALLLTRISRGSLCRLGGSLSSLRVSERI